MGDVMLAMQSEFILWADASHHGAGYGHPVQTARAVQRDVRTHGADYALSGVMVVLAIVVLASRIDVDTAAPRVGSTEDVARWVATIGCCLTLVGRRRWPLRCCGITAALLFVLGVTDNSDNVAYIAMLIGLYSAAEMLPIRRASAAIVNGGRARGGQPPRARQRSDHRPHRSDCCVRTRAPDPWTQTPSGR